MILISANQVIITFSAINEMNQSTVIRRQALKLSWAATTGRYGGRESIITHQKM